MENKLLETKVICHLTRLFYLKLSDGNDYIDKNNSRPCSAHWMGYCGTTAWFYLTRCTRNSEWILRKVGLLRSFFNACTMVSFLWFSTHHSIQHSSLDTKRNACQHPSCNPWLPCIQIQKFNCLNNNLGTPLTKMDPAGGGREDQSIEF